MSVNKRAEWGSNSDVNQSSLSLKSSIINDFVINSCTFLIECSAFELSFYLDSIGFSKSLFGRLARSHQKPRALFQSPQPPQLLIHTYQPARSLAVAECRR